MKSIFRIAGLIAFVFGPSNNLLSQGFIDVTPAGLSQVTSFYRYDGENNNYEVYVWEECFDTWSCPGIGYMFSRSLHPQEFAAGWWMCCCNPDPIPYGAGYFGLSSVARTSETPPRILSMVSFMGCFLLAPHAVLYEDSVVSGQNSLSYFVVAGCKIIMAVNPSFPDEVYVSAPDSFYRSTDGGETFQGLTVPCVEGNTDCLSVLAVHPEDGNVLFAGGSAPLCGSGSLLRSVDRGSNWTKVLRSPVHAISFSRGFPQILFAASDSGMYRSTDTGETWEIVKDGSFRSVEAGRPEFGYVYGGAGDGKLWRSTDGGSTWEIYNNSFTSAPIIGIHKYSDSDTLIVAATDGVFKVFESYVVGVKEEFTFPVRSFELHQNYPNPFNPTTSISYTIPVRSSVVLSVFDLLGRKVRVLVDQVQNPGFYEVRFDASSLAGGVYFLRLVAEKTVLTRKMIIQK